MSDVRRLFFRKMIQDIKANASRRTNEGDKNSLLNNVRTYEYAFNNDMMDFDYYNDFHMIYFDGKIPTYIIAEIFDQVKKYTGINIPSYTREERRDRNCNILKGCMIYNQVYEHFKIFTFVTRNHVVNQDIPNETLNIPDNLKNYILQNWGGSVTLPQIILNSLAQINPNIYGVIMFRFYHLIFVIPIKKIKLTSNAKYKIIYTDPITIPNIQPPPQINPPQIPPQYLLPHQRRQLQPPHLKIHLPKDKFRLSHKLIRFQHNILLSHLHKFLKDLYLNLKIHLPKDKFRLNHKLKDHKFFKVILMKKKI